MQSVPIPQLEDVIAPTEVSAWPPGPAWWLLAVLLIALVIALIVYLRARHKHLGAKREAMQLASTDDLLELHQILKRLCKHYYGAHVSAQSGQKWATTLSHLSNESFSNDELTAIYRAKAKHGNLGDKLKRAIVQFKTKEVLDV
ncbi:DUF4381 domain-containing protein [Pseudoalteromonas sp. SSDWG2]|uniref:DUF4381 domain-containing protein n=1 Tax=Pseudoalteromonas sp. SSDWG2 TaxID=3139391 RepID=UPI003BABE67E